MPIEFTAENAKKSDFLGIYRAEPKRGDALDDLGAYEASLLTRGRGSGTCTFIAPLEKGMYIVRLIRDDNEELASLCFAVA